MIPEVKKETLRKVVQENVAPGSTVSTDELMSYGLLSSDGFKHGKVKHGQKQFAVTDGGVSFHVNTVEGFWRSPRLRFARLTLRSARITCSVIATSSLSAQTTANA